MYCEFKNIYIYIYICIGTEIKFIIIMTSLRYIYISDCNNSISLINDLLQPM